MQQIPDTELLKSQLDGVAGQWSSVNSVYFSVISKERSDCEITAGVPGEARDLMAISPE